MEYGKMGNREGDDGPVENGAGKLISNRVGVYCGQRSSRGPTIVEEAKHINGMQSLAEREEE